MPKSSPRVLSIQSHVVHGYVGNKCAAFILQLYGFQVDVINTVHFSNHTGYETVKGNRLKAEELRAIFEGLIANQIFDYDYILTGYVGSDDVLSVIAEYIRVIKAKFPNVKYICDPVIGDNNKIYVDQTCVEVYIKQIVPLADILTPNNFEIEQITGKVLECLEVDKYDDIIWESLRTLHNMGPSHIIISSISFDKLAGDEHMLHMKASSKITDNQYETFQIDFPRLCGRYSGTGDSFTALILAWFHKENNITYACEKAISILHQIIKRTIDIGQSINVHNKYGKELCLIESKSIIESAETMFHATLHKKFIIP